MRTVSAFSAILLASSALLGGCATSRSVVTPELAITANPSQGPAVRIEQISDQRVFQLVPGTPDIPSLSDNDIQNKGTTSRAIARKRNGFGRAMGDVLLPAPQTVSDLTQGAIEQAFRESGYRVLGKGQAGYEEALPVSAEIKQFWAWMNPGFWAITLSQRTEVIVKAPIKPLEAGAAINTDVKDSMQMATESSWTEIVKKGLAEFAQTLKARLGTR